MARGDRRRPRRRRCWSPPPCSPVSQTRRSISRVLTRGRPGAARSAPGLCVLAIAFVGARARARRFALTGAGTAHSSDAPTSRGQRTRPHRRDVRGRGGARRRRGVDDLPLTRHDSQRSRGRGVGRRITTVTGRPDRMDTDLNRGYITGVERIPAPEQRLDEWVMLAYRIPREPSTWWVRYCSRRSPKHESQSGAGWSGRTRGQDGSRPDRTRWRWNS
ncbi:hypothetical protein SAMN04490239_0912 [Rhodococcus koreensis]|uniref:Uncharacterized protein n=1 Tax=Rhodococcus koreensis TaxID=99653 RepID=A0A1H4KUI2_9NOCA|nr:hypothetical protein SAMN04490239_0912 [Rhodococcus koreensis]